MTRYLDLEDVLRQVHRMGFVVRDAGLLASAVMRPQATAFGADAYGSLWEKAAALCQSIDRNQALVDGNKRLAWLVTKVFLRINGQHLVVSAEEGERFFLEIVVVAAHSLDPIAAWLSDHSQAISHPEVPDLPG